jgi:ketosteroid isomerase-like protein
VLSLPGQIGRSEEATTILTQGVNDQWAGFRETLQAGDYDGWAKYWTSDTRMFQPGMDLAGTEWFDYVRGFLEGGVQFLTFDIESFDLFVHGDAAYQVGQYDQTAELADGEPGEWHEYMFVRWEKGTDGMWRISRFLSAPTDG